MREGNGFRAMSVARIRPAGRRPQRPVGPARCAGQLPVAGHSLGQMLHIPDWLAVELPSHELRVRAAEDARVGDGADPARRRTIGVLGLTRQQPAVRGQRRSRSPTPSSTRRRSRSATCACSTRRSARRCSGRPRWRACCGHQPLDGRRAAGVRCDLRLLRTLFEGTQQTALLFDESRASSCSPRTTDRHTTSSSATFPRRCRATPSAGAARGGACCDSTVVLHGTDTPPVLREIIGAMDIGDCAQTLRAAALAGPACGRRR